MTTADESILIVANWLLRRSLDEPTLEILVGYAREVEETEPGTLIYRLHVGNPDLHSLPPVSDSVITFVELYENLEAFHEHTKPGSAFSKLVDQHSDLFVIASPFGDNPPRQNPINTAQFYAHVAGYVRGQ